MFDPLTLPEISRSDTFTQRHSNWISGQKIDVLNTQMGPSAARGGIGAADVRSRNDVLRGKPGVYVSGLARRFLLSIPYIIRDSQEEPVETEPP